MSDSLGKRIHRLRGEARIEAIEEVVSRWKSSGTSKASFCRAEGIATVTLGRWLQRLEAERAPARPPVLVEIGRREPLTRDGYEVVLSNGIEVRVPAAFDDEDLTRLLRVLVARC